MNNSNTDPVDVIVEICERASRGDFEARLSAVPGDERIQRLCRAINHLLDVADAYVRESAAAMAECAQGRFHRPILLRGLPGAYCKAALTINRAAVRMREASEQITDLELQRSRVTDQVRQTTDAVSTSANELDQSAQIILTNVRQTKELSESVKASATSTADSFSAVAAACEQLSASTGEISRQTNESVEATETVVRQAAEAAATARELGEAALKIKSVVNLINKIAHQTKLLAFNATIEAARAGEFGRGFGVVANEVKLLSQETSVATDSITEQVQSIQSAAGSAEQAIQAIASSIRQVNENASGISASLKEQVVATTEIARRVNAASGNTQEISIHIATVAEAATSTETAASQLTEASNRLNEQSASLRREVDGLAMGKSASKSPDLAAEKPSNAPTNGHIKTANGDAGKLNAISKAIGAHGIWKQRLRQAVDQGKSEFSPENVLPDNLCEFGKWLRTVSPEDQAGEQYRQVLELHAGFHREAAAVLRHVNMGQKSEAERSLALGGAYHATSANLTRAMMNWQRLLAR